MEQQIPEMVELEKKEFIKISLNNMVKLSFLKLVFTVLEQILQLKLPIEDEIECNKKSKEKLMALHEDIEKNVNIVTVQFIYYVCHVWLPVLIDGHSMAHNCSTTVGPLQELHTVCRLIFWHHKVL